MSTTETKIETKASALLTKRRQPERFALIGVWVVLIIVFVVLAPNTFPTPANLSNMLGSQAVLLILALGVIIPLRAGDYDLSIASVLTLSACTTAALNVRFGLPIWISALVGILSGVIVGALNGFIVTKFNINPFIVTLGMGTVAIGVSYPISNSRTITGVDSALNDVMLTKPFMNIPLDFWYGIILCAIVAYMFSKTAFGQRLLFIGQNSEVARLNGVTVPKHRWIALTLSGTIAAVAGVVYVGTTSSADPTSGGAFMLPAFAAAFLGSTALTVGRFNPWGTAIAVYFLVTGITGLQLLGAESYVQDLFYGGALVIAVVLSQVVQTRNAKKLAAA